MTRPLIFFSLLTAIVLLFPKLLPAAADEVQVGILGIDNFGSVAYTEFLNRPHAEGDFAGVRVVAACPTGSPDYPDSGKLVAQWKQQLLNMYQNPQDPTDAVPPIDMVGSVEELLARCDAAMIFSLDGRLHLEQASAVLRAGKRLFIGRPMAASAEDVVKIFQIAAATLEIFALLQAAETSRAQNGAMVRLPDLAAQANGSTGN
jgi:predicted dehydrogenase